MSGVADRLVGATHREVRDGGGTGYSWWLALLLTACLLFAEHHSAREMHGGVIDRAFISQERSGQVPRQIAYLMLGGLGALGMWRATRKGWLALRWNGPLTASLGALLVWAGLSVAWSDTPAITLKRLFVVGLMLLGATGLALNWSKRQMLAFIAVSAALQVCVGVAAEAMYGYLTPWAGDYRFGGTLHWNQQGYLCLVGALAALCLRRARYSALASFLLVMMLATRSRGALIGLAVALVLGWVLVLQPVAKVGAVLAAGTLLAAMMMTGVASRVGDALNRNGEGAENLTGRAPLWDELMTYVARRPWTGYGYEGFWTDNTIDDVSGHQHWSIDAAHSGYVEGMLTLGYVGVALHTFALLVAAWVGVRQYLRTRELVFWLGAALCLIYLVGGYLEAILIVKPSPISFYLAMLLAVMTVRAGAARAWVRVPASGLASSAVQHG